MSAYRTLIIAFSVSLAFFFTFGAVSTPAQGPPAGVGAGQSLAAKVEALEARVSKLEGNITAEDLVGTYNGYFFYNEVSGGIPTRIASFVGRWTIRLNSGGTGSVDQEPERGYDLVLGFPSSVTFPFGPDPGGTAAFTWNYADGALTLDFGGGDTVSLPVLAGGRIFAGTDTAGTAGTPGRGVTSLGIIIRR